MRTTMKEINELLLKLNINSNRTYEIDILGNMFDNNITVYALKVIRKPLNDNYVFTSFNTKKQMKELLITLLSYSDLEMFKDLEC